MRLRISRTGFDRGVVWGVAFALLLSVGCHRGEVASSGDKLDGATCAFDIHWPPLDPEGTLAELDRPLLNGVLSVEANEQPQGGAEMRLAVTITRPSTEDDRLHWNRELAFADIAWMDQVRVWDSDEQWLWPNLPYLLRLPGRQRVERYGGMDPGKHVDNDFAAVLIRQYDAAGRVESSATKDAPLVSAEWRTVDAPDDADLHRIIHTAKSDEFVVHLAEKNDTARGRLAVWLIYADFLGARAPRTWPKQGEWAGGILACFEIDWDVSPDGGCRGAVRQKRPEQSTGFDWAEWVVRTPGSEESHVKVRLSDRTERVGP